MRKNYLFKNNEEIVISSDKADCPDLYTLGASKALHDKALQGKANQEGSANTLIHLIVERS